MYAYLFLRIGENKFYDILVTNPIPSWGTWHIPSMLTPALPSASAIPASVPGISTKVTTKFFKQIFLILESISATWHYKNEFKLILAEIGDLFDVEQR